MATAKLVLHSQGLLPRAVFAMSEHAGECMHVKANTGHPIIHLVFATLEAGMHLVNKCLSDIAAVLSQRVQGGE